ncbi:MAG: glycosyltransferase family 2 protein [Candidatus Bathyarchaeota archaeon]|nr:glycosyltransferase family 2 protein [Candidatus Bathyarchaeota archaeon]
MVKTENYSLPSVSVIILNYNGKKYLDGCLTSLDKIDYPKNMLEIILVDNFSSDGSVDYVRKNYSWVKLLPLDQNYGFTGGNNNGVKIATGEYIVFLNNDVLVDKNWLTELIKVALSFPNAVVTSKSLFIDKPEIIDHGGSKATFIGRGFCINFGRKDDKYYTKPKFIIQPYGASMLIKKDVFESIGKFDEAYFTSLEDTDFGLRTWLYGYQVIYAPASVFYHVGGGTGGWGSRVSTSMVFHAAKNSYMNILKNYDLKHVIQGIILSLIYYIFIFISSIKRRRRNEVKAIFQAHIWILKNLRSILHKRSEIRTNKTKPYSILFTSSFFASLQEMINEYSQIQRFHMTNCSQRSYG